MKRLFFITMGWVMMLGLLSFKDNTRTSTASYYHDKFNGRKTASGEIFNNNELTAANKTLPFGTKVKVTNTKTGKSVIVRVNDRGPFTKNRDFDLSKAAFREIADIRSGIIPIEYEIITEDTPQIEESQEELEYDFTIKASK